MHSFEVHSNESACGKSGRLGLEQFLILNDISQSAHAHRKVIISKLTKFSTYCCHVLASRRHPYSVFSHVKI